MGDFLEVFKKALEEGSTGSLENSSASGYSVSEKDKLPANATKQFQGSFLDVFALSLKEEQARKLQAETAANAQKNLAGRSEFTRGLLRGVDTLQATYEGGLGMYNAAIGDQVAADKRFANYREQMRQASENPGTVTDFFSTDEKTGAFASPSNFGTYVAGTLGQAVPSLTEAVISGIAGAAVGAAIVPAPDPADVVTIPAGAIGGFLGRNAMRRAIASAAQQYASRGMAQDVAEQTAERYVRQAVANRIASNVGSGLAVSQTTALHEGGGMWAEGMEKGYNSPYSAIGLGQVSGFSEALFGAAPAAVRAVLGKAAVNEAAKELGWKQAAGYAWDVVKNSGEEGVQEAFQQYLGAINQSINDPKFKLYTKENFMQWAEAAAAGAITGGVVGGGSVSLQAIRDRKRQLEEIQSKGFVSESDAQQAGIEGASRRERMANLEAERQDLDRQEQELVAQSDQEFIQQQQAGQAPTMPPDGVPAGQVDEAGELIPQVSQEDLDREFAARMAAQGGNVTTPVEEETPASFAARMAKGEPITSLEDQQYRMNNAAAIEEELQKILASGATSTASPQPTAPSVEPVAEQQQRLTVSGTPIPKEYESLFNSEGVPLPWRFTMRFGEANGLGATGVRALQSAVLSGSPISVEQAKDLEAAEVAKKKQEFEQYKKETEEKNATDLEEQRLKPRETRTSADYQITTDNKGEFAAKVIRSSDGSVAVFADDFNVIEHNAAFAKDKTDEELLAYSFEPVGFVGAKKLFDSATSAEQQPAPSTDPFDGQQQSSQQPSAMPPAAEQQKEPWQMSRAEAQAQGWGDNWSSVIRRGVNQGKDVPASVLDELFAYDKDRESKSPEREEMPKAKIGDTVVRYTHKDGSGLLNNNELDRSKLTDAEEAELVELMDLGLQQPGSGTSGVFYFTKEGEQKHKRMIDLLSKASKKGVVRSETVLDQEPSWESEDGQIAVVQKQGRKKEVKPEQSESPASGSKPKETGIRLADGVYMIPMETASGIISPIHFSSEREMIFLRDDQGRGIWFYRSFMGTGGKTQGQWFPTGGVAALAKGGKWIVKGDTSDPGYGRPDLAAFAEKVNAVLPHSDKDMDEFIKTHLADYLKSTGGKPSLLDPALQAKELDFGKYEQGNMEHYGEILNLWKNSYLNRVWGRRGESKNKPSEQPADAEIAKKESPSAVESSTSDIDAMMEEEFKRQLEQKSKDQQSLPSEGKPPKKRSPRKKKPSTDKPSQSSQSKEDRKKEIEDLWSKLLSESKKRLPSGLDPELLRIAAQLAIKVIEDGVLTFSEFVKESVANIPSDMLDSLKPYMESAWRTAHRNKMTEDAGGKFDDYIKKPEESQPKANELQGQLRIPVAGQPFTFTALHNKEKSSDMGARFGQDKEPAGRYVVAVSDNNTAADQMPEKYDKREVTFQNPLVIDFGGGYQDATNWKQVLSSRYGGLTGKALSEAIRNDGYDGIVTVEPAKGPNRPAHTSEIVDLRTGKKTQKVEPSPVEKPAVAESEVDKTLRQAGLKVEKLADGTWQITGNTYEHSKEIGDVKREIRELGGFWDKYGKRWTFKSDPRRAIADRIAGKGVGEEPSDAGVSDEQMARERARRAEDAKADVQTTRDAYVARVDGTTRDLISRGLNYGMTEEVVSNQIEDIGRVVTAAESGLPMFVVGSAPGTGKTFVLGGVIRELRQRGFKRFVYVTQNEDLIDQVSRNLADYGLEGVEFTTYSKTRTNPANVSGAVLLLDEAHTAKNADRETGKRISGMVKSADFTVYATATPFENVTEAEYIGYSGVFDDLKVSFTKPSTKPGGRPFRNELYGFKAWAWMFGANVYFIKQERRGETVFVPMVWWDKHQTSEESQLAANEWLKKRGVFVQRPMSLPVGTVNTEFRAVDADQYWADISNKVVEIYDEAMKESESGVEKGQIKAHRENTLKRLLEASKVDAAISRAKELIGEGKESDPQVIMFVNTKESTDIGSYSMSDTYLKEYGIKGKEAKRKFTPAEMDEMMQRWYQAKAIAKKTGENAGPPPFAPFVHKIAMAMDAAGVMEKFPSVIDRIIDAFPGQAVEYSGRTASKNASNLAKWKNNEAKLIVATMAKGGTGLSFHDTTGKMPSRYQVNMNLPWSGTQVEQVSGRLARYGTAKPVNIEWIFANNIPFDRRLAKTVGSRMRSMAAAVQGRKSGEAKQIRDFDFEDSPVVEDNAAVAPWSDATVEDEGRWAGTSVNVSAKGKEEGYAGKVVRVLNKGETIEVQRDGFDAAVRVPAERVSIVDLVDNKPVSVQQSDKAAKILADMESNQERMRQDKKQREGEKLANWIKAFEGSPREVAAAKDLFRKDFEKARENGVSDDRLIEIIEHGQANEMFTEREASDLKERIKPVAQKDATSQMHYPDGSAYRKWMSRSHELGDHPTSYLSGHSSAKVREAAKQNPGLGLVITPANPSYVDHAGDYSHVMVDNGAFSEFTGKAPFSEDKFFALLDRIVAAGLKDKVQFVVVPDRVGSWSGTNERWEEFNERVRAYGMPLAYVGQDGIEQHLDEIPWDEFDVFFIGGSTPWKLGYDPSGEYKDFNRPTDDELRKAGLLKLHVDLIEEAKRRGKKIHMGRVNSFRRIEIANYGMQVDSADGNYIGAAPDKNLPVVLGWLNDTGGEMFKQKHELLLDRAAKYREKGQSYKRDIADPAMRLQMAIANGNPVDGTLVQSLAEELEIRLDYWEPILQKAEESEQIINETWGDKQAFDKAVERKYQADRLPIIGKAMQEEKAWYQTQDKSLDDKILAWLNGGDLPSRVYGDSSGIPIDLGSGVAARKRAQSLANKLGVGVAIVQHTKTFKAFLVELPVSRVDGQIYGSQVPLDFDENYELIGAVAPDAGKEKRTSLDKINDELLGITKEKVKNDLIAKAAEDLDLEVQPKQPEVKNEARDQEEFQVDSGPKEGDGRTSQDQGAARRIVGAKTKVGKRKAHYEVIEIDQLIGSHYPFGMAVNDQFPEEWQKYQRRYESLSDEQKQEVWMPRGGFDPSQVIDATRFHDRGPTMVVEKDGKLYVVGGTRRYMMLANLYRSFEDKAMDYHNALVAEAEMFGLDVAAVNGMDKPILIRVIDEPGDDIPKLVDELNADAGFQKDPAAESASLGRGVGKNTIAILRGIGDEETLAKFLDRKGVDVVYAMVSDNPELKTKVPNWVKGDSLTKDAKLAVQKAIMGAVISDATLINQASPRILQSVNGALAEILLLNQKGGEWSLSDRIKEAITYDAEFRSTGKASSDRNIDYWMNDPQQTFLEDFKKDPSSDGYRLWRYLLNYGGARKFRSALQRTMLKEARLDDTSGGLFADFEESMTGNQAFDLLVSGSDTPEEQLDEKLKNPPEHLFQEEPDIGEQVRTQALDLGIAALKAGVKNFEDFVAYSVDAVGEARTRFMGLYLEMVGKTVGMQGVRPTKAVLGVPMTQDQYTQLAKETFASVPAEQVEAGIEAAMATGLPQMSVGFSPSGTPVPRQGLMQDDFDQPSGYGFNESDYRPAVVAYAKDKWGDAIAPNGKPTWQNFVRWFGDSAVVDWDGKPRVVYHGSKMQFDEFKPEFFERENNWSFSSDIDVARTYQPQIISADKLYEIYIGLSDYYKSRFKTKVEPFIDNENGNVDKATVEAWVEEANYDIPQLWAGDLARAIGIRASAMYEASPEGQMVAAYLKLNNPIKIWMNDKYEEVKRVIPDGKHDGYIFYNVMDTNFPQEARITSTVYKVLDSNQIKSAAGNRGDFDPLNPNMLMQANVKTDTPAFKKWFGDSKVVDKDGNPLVVYHGTDSDELFEKFYTGQHFGSAKAANQRVSFRGNKATSRILPVYLSIQNPIRLSDQEAVDEASLLNAIIKGKVPGASVSVAREEGSYVAAKQAGYDGIVYRNLVEDAGNDSYVAFEPNQVKSAIANVGTFDPSDPNMLMQQDPSGIDADSIPKTVLDKMSRRLKSMGYDSRGAEDVRKAIKEMRLLDFQEDWIAAYQFAISAEQKRQGKAMAKKALKHINWSRLSELGETLNPNEAGYIKPDGALADFSGKREGGQPGFRSFDHREAGGTAGMQEVIAYGWIRMDENSGSLDIAKMPTPAQMSAITKMAQRKFGEIVLDLEDGLGEWRETDEYYTNPRRRWSQEYPEGTKPQRIINDIKKFFGGDTPNTLYQDETPRWYLKSRKLIQEKMGQKASAEQVLGMLRKNGVNDEELYWSGLEELLGNKQSVTKDEVLAAIDSGFMVTESQLPSDPVDAVEARQRLEAAGITLERGMDGDYAWENEDGVMEDEDIEELSEDLQYDMDVVMASNEESSTVRYAQYTTPGGENYRELLIRLPVKKKLFYSDRAEYRIGKPGDGKFYVVRNDEWQDEAYDTEAEAQAAIDAIPKEEEIDFDSVYESGHWSEHNVLAHLRFNERVVEKTPISEILDKLRKAFPNMPIDSMGSGMPAVAVSKGVITPEEAADWSRSAGFRSGFEDKPGTGVKTMFIEEIQSDWHQEGRKKGYAETESQIAARLRTLDLRPVEVGVNRWQINNKDGEKVTTLLARNADDAINRYAKDIFWDQQSQLDRVPDAPFKKSWPMLAMKRAIQYAVENGFNRIAWATGEQQAERYDLSKQIDSIAYWTPEQTTHGNYRLEVSQDGYVIDATELQNVPAEKLEDYVGKEMAQRIIEGDGEVVYPGQPLEHRELKGANLKVGGEGMKAFYDRILPSETNKLIKKFGGKVGQTTIKTPAAGTQGKRRISKIDDGWVIEVFDEDLDEWSEEEAFDTKEDAQARINEYKNSEVGVKVQSFDITPAMRQSALQYGQPLFQQQVPSGNVKGWTKFISGTRALIGATSKADISTVIHEFAHPIRRFLLDRKIPQDQRADITDEEIEMLEKKCGAGSVIDGKWVTKWDVPAEEKFARMWEQYWFEGKSPNSLLNSLFEKISRWMRGVYQSIQQITGGPLAPEVRELFDKLVQRGLTPEQRSAPIGAEQETLSPVPMAHEDELTSNANAVAEETRAILGIKGYADPARESFQQWIDEAKSLLRQDPTLGERLRAELSKKARSLTKVEEAVLSIHLRHIKNLIDRTSDRLFAANDANDSVAAAQALRETDMLVNQFEELTDAINKGGSETGRALVARKIALRADFTQGNLLRMARIANAGKSLSKEQTEEVIALARRIAELEGDLAKKTQEIDDLERKIAVQQSIDEIKKEIGGKLSRSTLRKKAAEKATGLVKKLSGIFVRNTATDTLQQTEDEQLAEEARDVIKAYVDAGVYSFGEFMSKFKKDIGMDVPVSARAAFSTVWTEMREQGDIPTPQLTEPDTPEVRRIARMLQQSLVEDGITDPDEVIEGVYESLQEILPEITRRESMDAMSYYGQYSKLSPDPNDAIIRDLNGQYQQMAKLDDMRQGMAPKKTGRERRTPSDKERELIQQVNQMKRNSKYFITDPESQLKSIFQSTRTALRNRIYDLSKAINITSTPIPGREGAELSAEQERELEQYRKLRDELMAEYKRTFPKPGATFEQRAAAAERAADRAIAEIEKEIASGKMIVKGRPEPISTPALNAKLARLDALKAAREAAFESQIKEREEQRAEKAYIANLLAKIADYEDRKRQGYFEPRGKKERRKLSPQEVELSRQLADRKDEFFRLSAEYRLANMGRVEKAWDNTKETMHLSRAIMTSFDLSAVFRQGGIASLAHPRLSLESAREMRAAIFSQSAEFKSIDDIEKDSLYTFAMQCGLPITTNKGKIERQEEAYMGRLVRYGIGKKGTKLNKFTLWALKPISASARAYTVYLNSMRFKLFKYLVSNLGVDGSVTLDEGKVIAAYVGVATGRAELGKFNQVAANLNTVFFAPRYVASRFQYLAMPFYILPSTKVSGRVKKMIAMEYARHAMGLAAFLGLSVALGSLLTDDEEEKPTVEFDPRSSDFMKLRIGETRIDPMAGLSQTVTLIGQLSTGQKKQIDGGIQDLYGKNRKFGDPDLWDVTTGFIRKKLAPIPGAIVDLRVGENVIGEKETPLTVATDLFIPLAAQEVGETMKARGLVGGLGISALSLLGMGGGTYGPRTAYATADKAKRLELLNKDLDNVKWDSKDPVYSDFLTVDELETFKKKREQRKQSLVYAASADPKRKEHASDDSFKQSVAERDKAFDAVIKAGMGYEEIKKLLIAYYKRNYGSAYEIRGGNYQMKESLTNRLRAIKRKMNEKQPAKTR